LGWYDGFHLLTAVTPDDGLTVCAVAPAQTKEQTYAEDFLAARAQAVARTAMVGAPATEPYLADAIFEGCERHQRWAACYRAVVWRHPAPTARRTSRGSAGSGTPGCARLSRSSTASGPRFCDWTMNGRIRWRAF
jgi:hypothetical protein